jgi:hypothetical protein
MERISQSEYISLITKELKESVEIVAIAVECFGRNFKAIQIFLIQNRGCGDYI